MTASRPFKLLLTALVSLCLVATSCSDAPSNEDLDRTDLGTNPNVVVLFAAPAQENLARALGEQFAQTHRPAQVIYVIRPTTELIERYRAGLKPGLWIAPVNVLDDLRATSERRAFLGNDHLVGVLERGNMEVSADSFTKGGKGSSGLCVKSLPCGAAARRLLAAQGIKDPVPDQQFSDELDMVAAVADGRIDVAIAYTTGAYHRRRRVTIFKLPPELSEPLRYDAQAFGPGAPTDMIEWIAKSDEAVKLSADAGLDTKPIK